MLTRKHPRERVDWAILDRFLHHTEIIKMEGRSYRMHDRKELRRNVLDQGARLTEKHARL